MKRFLFISLIAFQTVSAQITNNPILVSGLNNPAATETRNPIQYLWGDQGNGTYINPVLNADYSDPDVIRVGRKFYMVASVFHFLEMQILESDDLVNWTVLTQLYNHACRIRLLVPGITQKTAGNHHHGHRQSCNLTLIAYMRK